MGGDCGENGYMRRQNHQFHSGLILISLLLLGAFIRFWNLDLKPLWLDEAITALFSLGRSYQDVPLEVMFPVTDLSRILSYQPSTSCEQISQSLLQQSSHPPLFFCGMHQWLGWLQSFSLSLAWKLRSLPALLGVVAIFAVYVLNWVAFSPLAGLAAAAVMTVSPFGVYLSQEARHYTLPIVFITFSLTCFIQILKNHLSGKISHPFLYLSFILFNTLGLYSHYLFILPLIAELLLAFATFARLKVYGKLHFLNPQFWVLLSVSFILPGILFIPWLMVVLPDLPTASIDWISSPQHIAPFYQLLAWTMLMLVNFPIENQPFGVMITTGVLSIVLAGFLMAVAVRNLKKLWTDSSYHWSIFWLASFLLFVLLELILVIYSTGKDLSVAPRYSFIYFPVFCSLMGVGLTVISNKFNLSQPFLIFLFVGSLSCSFVVSGVTFQKPYNPQVVAQHLFQQQDFQNLPTLLVMMYQSPQDVALGLSFALESPQLNQTSLASDSPLNQQQILFLDRSANDDTAWQKLTQTNPNLSVPFSLWIAASHFDQKAYPNRIAMGVNHLCQRDIQNSHRLGITYQRYLCNPN